MFLRGLTGSEDGGSTASGPVTSCNEDDVLCDVCVAVGDIVVGKCPLVTSC